jgi:hypothetical protein
MFIHGSYSPLDGAVSTQTAAQASVVQKVNVWSAVPSPVPSSIQFPVILIVDSPAMVAVGTAVEAAIFAIGKRIPVAVEVFVMFKVPLVMV